MSQYSWGVMDPDAESGTELAVDLNAWRDALLSGHSGSSRPAYAVQGMVWINTTLSPHSVYLFDGTNDLLQGYIDPTNHVWSPVIGGGINSISSATSTDIGGVKASHVTINAAASPITGFGSNMAPGQCKTLIFGGGLTLNHHATLLNLPSGGNTIVSAGDRMVVVCTAVGNYTVLLHVRAGAESSEFPGCVKEHSGLTLPPGYLWADGSLVSRSTYAALFNAITLQITGSINSAAKVITGIASTTGVARGMPISIAGAGAAGALLQTVITDFTVNTITILTAASTTVAGAAIIVAPWGLGNGTTTFALPFRQGRIGIGRDDLSGAAANNIQFPYTVATTNTSAAITITTGGFVAVGQAIAHPNVPPGTRIIAVAANQLSATMDQNAFATGSATGRFSIFQDANRVGSWGGAAAHYLAQHEQYPHTHTITITDPTHSHTATVTDPTHNHDYLRPSVAVAGTPNTSIYGSAVGDLTGNRATGITVGNSSNATGVTAASSNQTTNYNPFLHADPAVIMNYVVKT